MSEKVFCANADIQRRKFLVSVNQVITQGKCLSEEILMHVLKTHCVPILVDGCEIWSDKAVELNKVIVCLNKSIRIFNMKLNESVKYILMSFNVLLANFLILLKKLMLRAKVMLSVNNIKNCCGMRWTESDEWVRVNSMFNFVCMGRSHIVNRIWDTFVDSVAI